MTESEFNGIITDSGGELYIVGGYVRDCFMGISAHDKDYVVCKLSPERFVNFFPQVKSVGMSFPVYLLEIDGKQCEIAMARTERKVKPGYRGFAVQSDENICIEQDLYRRDTTMNSIAISVSTGEIIDPYNGRNDIKNKIIRAVSPHFCEDPIRVLRAARQASQFNFTIEPNTLSMMNSCCEELKYATKERVFKETEKALGTKCPSVYFRALYDSNVFEAVFSKDARFLSAADKPDKESFDYRMHVLDRVANLTDRVEVRAATMIVDLKQNDATAEISDYKQSVNDRKLLILEKMNCDCVLPRLWYLCMKFALEECCKATMNLSADEVVNLILKIDKSRLGIDGYKAILMAYDCELPEFIKRYDRILEAIAGIDKMIPNNTKGRKIGILFRQRQIEAYLSCIKEN